MKRKESARVLFATLLSIGLGATNAKAIVPNCSTVTTVTESCGWVISTPGCYKLQNSLTATTNAGDCIQINSSNVYLDLNTQTITGTGSTSTGNGVHVLAATTPKGVAITNVAVQGGSISGFDTGVLVGNTNSTPNVAPFPTKVRLDNIVANGISNNQAGSNGFSLINAKLAQLSGLYSNGSYSGGVSQGALDGLSIVGGSGNHVSNSTFTQNYYGVAVGLSNGNVFSGVTATFNLVGFLLSNHASDNHIDSPSADFNVTSSDFVDPGAAIIVRWASNGNTILGGHANGNGGYGVWITQASANEISGIDLSKNGNAGIYLGCDGPTTGTCTTGDSSLPPGSNGNGIDANINITTTANPGYGIAIDKGNLNNTVVGNTSSANGTLDEYDGNKCGVNNWFADTFGTSNAACVH
jgi:hypothetical protein